MDTAALSNRPYAPVLYWLWVPVLAIGLAVVLAGPAPPGVSEEAARAAAVRMLHGDFGIGWTEMAAAAAVAFWLIAKQLAVLGALVWLELRFRSDDERRDLVIAWIMRASCIILAIGVTVSLSLLDLLPGPLIHVGEAADIRSLLLIVIPAFVLNLLVLEFFHYWVHRAFHHFPLLWRLHAVHHSLHISVLKDISHPVEVVLATLWVAIPSAPLIGVSDEQLFLLIAFTSIHSHISHTRMPIHLGPLGDWLLCDKRYHFIHHSIDPEHHNKNFAERFPVLDMMFGTHHPGGTGTNPVGLADRPPPQRLGEYLTVKLQPRMQAGS